jgi:hypothetical protein
MPIRPSQIHPKEHLRPVGRFRPSGTGADRQERPALVVLAVEQQRGPLAGEVRLEGGSLLLELAGQLRIARLLDELEGREEVVGPRFEVTPQLDLAAEVARLAKNLLRCPLVVPEAGFCGQRLEL